MHDNEASAHAEGLLGWKHWEFLIRDTAQEVGILTLPEKSCKVQYESLVLGSVSGLLVSSFSRFYRVQTTVCQ